MEAEELHQQRDEQRADPAAVPTADEDLYRRWRPTAGQMAVARAMLAAAPDATEVLVAVALPGKLHGVWEIGQSVEPAAGFWLAGDQPSGPQSWRHARDAAEAAALTQLGGRFGQPSWIVIRRDDMWSPFEGHNPADAQAAALDRLVALATEHGLGDMDLDDVVHDVASRKGDHANNRGITGQLAYLLGELGESQVAADVRRLHRKATPRSLPARP